LPKTFLFYIQGGCPRDDDIEEEYGSVCYLYNDAEVLVSAPIAMNDFDTGWAIYAGLFGVFAAVVVLFKLTITVTLQTS
jgi:hypothetical protein